MSREISRSLWQQCDTKKRIRKQRGVGVKRERSNFCTKARYRFHGETTKKKNIEDKKRESEPQLGLRQTVMFVRRW